MGAGPNNPLFGCAEMSCPRCTHVSLNAPPPATLAQQQEVGAQSKQVKLVMWVDATLAMFREELLELLTHLVINLQRTGKSGEGNKL